MDLLTIVTIVTLVAALVGIPPTAHWAARLWWRRSVTIRFKWGWGRRFRSSFDLYEANFPVEEINSKHEVRRWLRDHRRLRRGGNPSIAEYWVSSFQDGQARGLFNGTLYTHSATLFVSYLLIDRGLSKVAAVRVRNGLFTEVRKAILEDGHKCDNIIAEVEHPWEPNIDERKRRKRIGKIKRLIRLAKEARISLTVLKNVSYIQPKLDLDDLAADEVPMLLLYGRLNGPTPETLPRDEVANILTFVYESLYGDCFMDDPEKDSRWRLYLAKLCRKAKGELPRTIRCGRSFGLLGDVFNPPPPEEVE